MLSIENALERFNKDNPADIIEGEKYCLQSLIPMMWKEYHKMPRIPVWKF